LPFTYTYGYRLPTFSRWLRLIAFFFFFFFFSYWFYRYLHTAVYVSYLLFGLTFHLLPGLPQRPRLRLLSLQLRLHLYLLPLHVLVVGWLHRLRLVLPFLGCLVCSSWFSVFWFTFTPHTFTHVGWFTVCCTVVTFTTRLHGLRLPRLRWVGLRYARSCFTAHVTRCLVYVTGLRFTCCPV